MAVPTDHLDPRIGIRDVERMTGLHRATIWRKVRGGAFPTPVYVSEKRTWLASEIRTWIGEQAERPRSARRGAANLGEHANVGAPGPQDRHRAARRTTTPPDAV
ncbi:MAG TPA: AlpA family phage regulatory protein [Anaeromyxobacter sp.]|nr:AlpA family phage regulatory protein [Anaeromyxobacter sp.]